MSHKILEGAFLVADAHYSHARPELLDFFKAIDSGELQPTQLILMGDIFDALFGGVKESYAPNDEAISLLNSISQKIELLYLEGNHDFNLAKIFSHAKIFPIQAQPVACEFEGRSVALAHGDLDGPLLYRLYAKTIRSPLTLFFLAIINRLLKNKILDDLDSYLSKKDDCKEFIGFEEFTLKRELKKYGCDYFIDGHFHQNRGFLSDGVSYFNLGAFACNQRYFIVKSSDNAPILQEMAYSNKG